MKLLKLKIMSKKKKTNTDTVTMSVPEGLEFNTSYTISESIMIKNIVNTIGILIEIWIQLVFQINLMLKLKR